VYRGKKKRLFIHMLLYEDGKDFKNLYSGVAFHMIKKGLIIFGARKLRLKKMQ